MDNKFVMRVKLKQTIHKHRPQPMENEDVCTFNLTDTQIHRQHYAKADNGGAQAQTQAQTEARDTDSGLMILPNKNANIQKAWRN